MNEKDLLNSLLAAAILSEAVMPNEEKSTTQEDKKQNFRKKSEDLGNLLYQAYLGFKDAGFNDEQAFQLVLTVGRK